MDRVRETAAMKELEQYAKEFPEWMDEARKVINSWSHGEHLHIVAVAMGLQQAYANGKAGRKPSASEAPPRISRTPRASGGASTVKRTRRTRPCSGDQ